MQELKDRLAEARKDKKLSQAKLAKLIGVNQSVIGSLENGHRKTSAYIPVIAEALGVEALWLAEGKLPKHKTHQILTFDESILSMLGMPCEQVSADLIKDIRKFVNSDSKMREVALKLAQDPQAVLGRRSTQDRRHEIDKHYTGRDKRSLNNRRSH